ncbi:MAG: T9SS type A sorting domain-containing protein [Vicingaceae bacterium]
MKNLLSLFTAFLLCQFTMAQTTIYSQSFESTTGYSFPNGNGGSGSDFFDRTDLAGAPPQDDFTYAGFDGTYFIAAEDIDGTLSSSQGVVYIDNIDISSQANLSLTLALASGTSSGIDENSDSISIEVKVGNGAWTVIGRFRADPATTSSSGFNGQLAEDTDNDGLGDGTRLNGTFQDFTWLIPGSGDSLDVRITCDLGSGNEEAAFDNLRISGAAAGSMFATITATTDASCNGGSDGSIAVSVTNGTANFDYAWSNGMTTSGSNSTTNTINGLAAGTYTVTVTDANNSTATASATISEPTAVSAIINVDNNASCNGGADGSLTAAASGGSGGYTYLWSNGSTNQTAASLSAGVYQLTVTDANGCTATAGENIAEPTAISITLDSLANASCAGGDGLIRAQASGGTGELTFSWSNGLVETATTTAFSQSFESNSGSWTYTASPNAYNTSGDVWDTVSSISSISAASDQTNFWGMQDLDNGNGGGSFYHTLTFDPVNVSGLNNAEVRFDYYTNGFDSSDEIEYEVVFDNGTTWSTNGTTLNKNTGAWTTISVPIPSSASFVRLRIQASQNGGSDQAGVDNVQVLEVVNPPASTNSNLSAGNYSLTVTDENACSSTATYSITKAPCAGPPVGLDIRSLKDTSVILLWDAIAGADLYKITLRPSTSPNWTITEFKNITGWTRRVIDGLVPGTKYFWTVNARVNGNWTGPATLEDFTTPTMGCSNPTALNVNFIKSDRAQLAWATKPGVVRYRIRYKEVGTNNWILKAAPQSRGIQYLKGLNPGTTYEWKMRSVCSNRFKNAWVDGPNFTTSVPTPGNARIKAQSAEASVENLTLYPNPNQGQFTVDLGNYEEAVEVEIKDVNGRQVYNQRFGNPQQTHFIDTKIQESGVYFMLVKSNDEQKVMRIVIQK